MEGFTLNPLDIIIAAVIGVGMYMGAKRGIIKGLARWTTIGLAVFLGFRFRKIAESILVDYLNVHLSSQTMLVASFAVAFIVVFVLVSAVLRIITQGLGKINVGIDSAIGSLLGGTVATLILSIAFAVLTYVNFPSPDNARGSVLYEPVKKFARFSFSTGMDVLREVNKQMSRQKEGKAMPPKASQDPESQPETEKPKAVR